METKGVKGAVTESIPGPDIFLFSSKRFKE